MPTQESLVIHPGWWVRTLLWINFSAGVVCLVAGLCVVAVQDWSLGLPLLMVGLLLPPVSRVGIRIQVRCDNLGITYRSFRSLFVPAADIESLVVDPVAGIGGMQRAAVAVVRRDGSKVRLDPTLVVRSGPEHKAVLARIAAMEHILGLDARAPWASTRRSVRGP